MASTPSFIFQGYYLRRLSLGSALRHWVNVSFCRFLRFIADWVILLRSVFISPRRSTPAIAYQLCIGWIEPPRRLASVSTSRRWLALTPHDYHFTIYWSMPIYIGFSSGCFTLHFIIRRHIPFHEYAVFRFISPAHARIVSMPSSLRMVAFA